MNKRRDLYAILFVQCAPSQLDSSFYSELSERTGGRIALALMHDGNTHRTQADPELGVIPQFPPLNDGHPILHLPSEKRGGLKKLIALIFKLRPHLLVVQDQTWRSKIAISIACRMAGVKVIMRSDKNELSSTSKSGLQRLVEILLVKALFDGIAPISKLTVAYYRWGDSKTIWWFPYPSSKSKFSRGDMYWDIRQRVRNSFGIPKSHCVYLAVVKFVERENPDGVIQAFHELRRIKSDVSLLIVGAGPMEAQLKAKVNDLRIENLYFCGYIPYSHLQDFFWAADVFVHLAWIGPWEVSPQDALVAKMCLVTSNRVGSGVCHLDEELSRFVVAPEDPFAAAQAMLEASDANAQKLFSKAWTSVTKYFTSEELAKWWADEIGANGWLLDEFVDCESIE